MSIIDYPNGSTNANPLVLSIGSLTQMQVTSGSATQSGVISESGGSGGLEKIGSGTLIFAGANTYTGGTFIRGGTLKLGTSSSLPTNGTLIFSDGATLDLNNNNQTVGQMAGGAGNILLGSGTLSVVFGGTAGFSGVISGTGGLIKGGNGSFTLGGNNTYSGGTTINGGELVLSYGGTSGSILGDVTDNAALFFQHSDATTFSGVISGTGTVGQVGTGILTLTAVNTYTGATLVSRGTLLVDGAIASSAVVVGGGAILGGSGTVGTTEIQTGGKLTPGDGIGTLQVQGNLTLASGALFAEELSPGAADEVFVSGNARIAGNFAANFSGSGTYRQTYIVLHATGSLSGSFANISVTGLPAGMSASLTYGAHEVTLTLDGGPVTLNNAPLASTTNITASQGQGLALSSLFSVSDADGDAITRYQLWDATRDPASGHFVVNGVNQLAGQIIEITAAQLAQTSFVTGSVSDVLQIRAFDGRAWSAGDNAVWAPFTVSVLANRVPVVTTGAVNAQANQSLALSSLFSVSDADGDSMIRYQIWDSTRDPTSGHFVINGVAQAAGQVIEITAAQLAQTSFVTGGVSDILQIRAFDGLTWSAADNAVWAPFTVSASHTPVVTTGTVNASRNQSLALSSLFSVSDPDGDSMTRYQLWDSTRDPASGHFVVNGVDQLAGQVIDITAAQLVQTSFVAGVVNDVLKIRAFDGQAWSANDNAIWAPFTVSVPANHAPVVATGTVNALANQSLALSTLFSVNDSDGDSMTRYQLWDSTRDPASGHFVVNGVDKPAGQVIDITAAELAQTSFQTGSVNDILQIRAFDGAAWSAGDASVWAPFTVSVPVNHAPIVTTGAVSAQRSQTLVLSSLFSVSDPDGDSMTRYQLWDSTRDPASGHFVVNGVHKLAGQVIDITAAELAQTSFQTGGVSDILQIRAFDGLTWSAADNAVWAPFTVSVPVNHAPVLTTGPVSAQQNQSLTLSSLFSINDTDGDSMTRYQLWDSTRDPASGHFVIGGADQAAGQVIDITAAQLAQTSFMTGTVNDILQIRAFDGFAWSAADNANWAPFHISVA